MGLDRPGPPSPGNRRGGRAANPRSTGRRRSGGAAADLRPAAARGRQARPHAGLRPPGARAVPRQLRAGRPGAEAAAGPGTAGQVGRPEQANLRAERHAAGVVGRGKGGGRRAKAASRETAGSRQAASQNDSEVPTALTLSPSSNPPFPIILVDCNRAPKPNVAVQAVDIEAAIPMAGAADESDRHAAEHLDRRPTAAGGVADRRRQGKPSSPELNLPPLGRAKHEFTFTVKQGGLHRGEVRLVGEDGSKYDDRRFFTVEVDQGIPVAVVKPGGTRFPISTTPTTWSAPSAPAAASGGAIRVTTMTADRPDRRAAGEVQGAVLRQFAGPRAPTRPSGSRPISPAAAAWSGSAATTSSRRRTTR